MPNKPINVLLIDDDEDFYCLFRGQLAEIRSEQYQLSWEYGYEAAAQRMRQNDQDVCLLDYRLGEYTGVDLLRVARAQGFKAPIIFLTGSGDGNVDREAMQAGAVDFLPKRQTDAALLERAIRYAMAHAQTLAALHQSEQRYKTLLEAVTNYIYKVKIEQGQALPPTHSPSCQAVTGYTAEELMQEPALLQRMIHPDDWPLVCAQTNRALAGEVVAPFEYRLHHKAGPLHWVRNTIVLWHNDQGTLVGYDSLIADITERQQMAEHLRYMGYHDSLTSLHNRTFFAEAMAQLEQQAQYPVSLIIADMDGLKAVNDQQGHAAGDEMLKRTAALLKASFPADAVVARLGGDEFGLLLPNTPAAAVAHTLAQLRQELATNDAVGQHLPLHISFGAATVQAGGSLSAGLKQADQQMYQEKMGQRASRPHALFYEERHP